MPASETSTVRLLLRLEGAAALIAGLVAYYLSGGSWLMLLILFLAPDLAIAGYAFGPKIGAVAYNAVHTYLGPALLAGAAWGLQGSVTPYLISAIWIAHIGMDRAFGFGLKYPTGFKFTHLSAPHE